MTTEGAAEVSALFDGELEEHEVRDAIRAGLADPLRWQVYALIGDVLRDDELPALPDLTASVMARVREEPVVLAPRRLPGRARHRPWLALAASVAGVAVVAWLALVGNPSTPVGERLAATDPATVLPAPTPARPAARSGRMDLSEYLLAHHAQAANVRLDDGTQHIRTVSVSQAQP